MRSLLRHILPLPAKLIGAAAALCFASSQVWAQASSPARSSARTSAPSTGPAADAGSRPAGLRPVVDLTKVRIAGEVRNMVLQGDSVEVTYANNGTLPTIITGEVQVYLTEDDLKATMVFAEALAVNPGATHRFRVAMPKLDRGRYTMIAIVDYGGETMTAAKAALEMR